MIEILEQFIFLLPSMFSFAIMFIALLSIMAGELLIQRSGQLNFSIEGMITLASVACFMGTYLGNSFYFGVIFACLATLTIGLWMAVCCVFFNINQLLMGLAVSIIVVTVCLTLSITMFEQISIEQQIVDFVNGTPYWIKQYFGGETPWWLPNYLIIVVLLFVVLLLAYIRYSRFNRILKAVVESDDRAYNIGLSVRKIRFFAWLIGSLFIGFGVANLMFVTQALTVDYNFSSGYIISAFVLLSSYRFIRLSILTLLLTSGYMVIYLDLYWQAWTQPIFTIIAIVSLIYMFHRCEYNSIISSRFGINYKLVHNK